MKLFSFASLFKKPPLSTVKSKSYHFSRKAFYEDRNHFRNMISFRQLEPAPAGNYFDVEEAIQFYGLGFESQSRDAIKHLGKPNYILKPASQMKPHTLFFYKLTISKVKCIIQLHFFNDLFFAAVIELRSERRDFKRRVTQLIKKKYGIADDEWTGHIVDQHKNRIELKDDVIPHIVFKTGNRSTLDNIQFHTSRLSYKMASKSDRELDFLLDII